MKREGETDEILSVDGGPKTVDLRGFLRSSITSCEGSLASTDVPQVNYIPPWPSLRLAADILLQE